LFPFAAQWPKIHFWNPITPNPAKAPLPGNALCAGGWAIVYYVDHAAREVKIGRIQRPDR
jgi:hypothetical protein